MPDEPDMDAPVTRRELHRSLETWAGAIIENLTATLTAKMQAMFDASERRLYAEIARATSASAEALRAEIAAAATVTVETVRADIRAIDDQYKTLPARVDRLEGEVFKPKPKRRARG